MKKKIFVLSLIMCLSVASFAQSTSTYSPISSNDSDVVAVTNDNNLKLNSDYLNWQKQYEEVGSEINDVAAQIDQRRPSVAIRKRRP